MRVVFDSLCGLREVRKYDIRRGLLYRMGFGTLSDLVYAETRLLEQIRGEEPSFEGALVLNDIFSGYARMSADILQQRLAKYPDLRREIELYSKAEIPVPESGGNNAIRTYYYRIKAQGVATKMLMK
jgi:hypothetical protein